MLIKCLECYKEISDKAVLCPNCVFPIKPTSRQPRKSNRRKWLPNGFEQITEIKGLKGLRKPFRASVTVCKNDVGRPICKYFYTPLTTSQYIKLTPYKTLKFY